MVGKCEKVTKLRNLWIVVKQFFSQRNLFYVMSVFIIDQFVQISASSSGRWKSLRTPTRT